MAAKRKSFAVIGLGRFGLAVARTLVRSGADVLVVDKSEHSVQEMASEVTHAVQADTTDEAVLSSLGLRNFDVAIVAIGADLHASILTTLLLKDIGVPYIVAKAATEQHARVLEKVGADRVVRPEREMGERIANSLTDVNVVDYIELAPGFSVVEIVSPRESHGKTLKQLNWGARLGVNIVAIKRGEEIKAAPSAQDVIERGDVLLLKDLLNTARQNSH
jgi:trk system potassium uptake protein TrkA